MLGKMFVGSVANIKNKFINKPLKDATWKTTDKDLQEMYNSAKELSIDYTSLI